MCDNAAGEACPFWPGHPATAHWGYADPSDMGSSEEEKLAAFSQTMSMIRSFKAFDEPSCRKIRACSFTAKCEKSLCSLVEFLALVSVHCGHTVMTVLGFSSVFYSDFYFYVDLGDCTHVGLGIGWSALIGATVALCFGVVQWADVPVVWGIESAEELKRVNQRSI
ncbi:hypothetical protein OURE66S_04563 [Oligella ureolytica]